MTQSDGSFHLCKMNYLSVENLKRSYGERVLFEDLCFGISKGQKVALVARNGTGKTSLLNIIAGLEPPEAGEVVKRRELRMGFPATGSTVFRRI